MSMKSKFLAVLVTGLCGTNTFALPFSIVPTGPLPTSVTPGASASAQYLITNQTARTLTSNFVKWLPPNVQVNPTFTTCAPFASNFTLTSGQSCSLSLSILGAVNGSDPDPHHHLFVCASDRASCSGPSPENSLNVSTPSVNNYAYVANNGESTVSLCPIVHGTISSCTVMNDSSFSFPAGLALNPAIPLLYVTNNHTMSSTYSVSLCSLNQDGTIKTCNGMTDATFVSPEGMAFNATGTIAYITEGSGSTVSLCPVNTDGTFSTCTDSTGNGTFNNPTSITLNKQNSLAYVVNTNNDSVSLCTILVNGTFGVCTALTDTSFVMPEGIALNPAGNIAYITNNNDTVSLCPITGTGSFLTCTVLTGNFTSPEGIALNSAGTIAYITNTGDSSISECPINSNGTFGTCTETHNNLDAPVGIVLN